MNCRKITSLTLLFSLILTILTSVILYTMPHGRVAYWSDWHFMGMDKPQWGALHLNLGLLFILSGILHIYYNWSVIIAYFKESSSGPSFILNKNFSAATLITFIFISGTFFYIPPFSSIVDLSEIIKAKAGLKYGEPPYGHAELSSLKMFSKKNGLDLEKSMKLMREAGVQFENEGEKIIEISKQNNITPKKLYSIIKPAAREITSTGNILFPDSPVPGFGRKKLFEICQNYNLDIDAVKNALKRKGFASEESKSIKEIANENSSDPMTVFEIIKEVAEGN